MSGVSLASPNTSTIGLNQCRLYRCRVSATGYADLVLDFRAMRPPAVADIRKVSTVSYYDVVCNNGNVLSIVNPFTNIKWTAAENPIDYVGGDVIVNRATSPTRTGYLLYSDIQKWFVINGYDNTKLVHSLITTAQYVNNVAFSRYEFTWPGSVTTPKAVRVRASVLGGDANAATDSPSFYITYKENDDFFEPTAFQWQFFEMSYNENKLRKLKYFTGVEWKGVPVKMWNGSAWTEVILKTCTATDTFTKISG